MSNANNYAFANHLEVFRTKVLEPQIKKVEEAGVIMNNSNYKWESDDQKKAGEARYASYKQWMQFYQTFYEAGLRLCTQHEGMVNKLAKWYGKWYDDVSNEGKQEVEMMSEQADFLNDIFSEMWQELKPLNLDLPMPQALNLE
jgi:hypothetical protein